MRYDQNRCPIWGTPSGDHNFGDNGVTIVPSSYRTFGSYRLTMEALTSVLLLDDSVKKRLTTWLVDQHNAAVHMPVVTIDIIKSAERSQPLGIVERAKRLLAYLAQRYEHIGTPIGIELPPHDVSHLPAEMLPNPTRVLWECMAWTESTMASEVEHLLKHLDENGWIQWDRNDPLSPDFVTVSVAGHQRDEAQRGSSSRPNSESGSEEDAQSHSSAPAASTKPKGDPMVATEKPNPTTFVSYSWDSEEHKSWVRDLAYRLRNDGIDVKLDQWETAPGDQLTEFMERGVREHDFVVIVCTPKYKERSDSRAGGVGYEGDIMTAEVLQDQNHRKFIPVLRTGLWEAVAPSWLKGKLYIDLSSDPRDRDAYQELLTTLLGQREIAPPLGQPPERDLRDDQ